MATLFIPLPPSLPSSCSRPASPATSLSPSLSVCACVVIPPHTHFGDMHSVNTIHLVMLRSTLFNLTLSLPLPVLALLYLVCLSSPHCPAHSLLLFLCSFIALSPSLSPVIPADIFTFDSCHFLPLCPLHFRLSFILLFSFCPTGEN